MTVSSGYSETTNKQKKKQMEPGQAKSEQKQKKKL